VKAKEGKRVSVRNVRADGQRPPDVESLDRSESRTHGSGSFSDCNYVQWRTGHDTGDCGVFHRLRDDTARTHSVYAGANDVEEVVPKNSERGQVALVNFVRIRPAGQACDDVEFPEELGNLFGVDLFGKAVGFGNDSEEGGFNVIDGLGAVVLTLRLKAFVMFHEFFSIELT